MRLTERHGCLKIAPGPELIYARESAVHQYHVVPARRPGIQPPREFSSARAHQVAGAISGSYTTRPSSRRKSSGAAQAKKELVWFKPWNRCCNGNCRTRSGFRAGKLNVSYNCLDRHLGTPTANRAAMIWEGEPAGPGTPGDERTLTYKQLHREVCLFANVLKRNGIKRATASLFICRWCRKRRSRCWHAPGSARCIR